MQQALAKCSKISISCKGVQMPSLLDLGSEVSLICHTYFKEHLLPRIEIPMGEKADALTLFNLTAANDGQLPIKMYTKFDINVFGLKVLNVSCLILEEPNSVLDRKNHTKLPGIIGWNLIWLAYKVSWENMGKKFLTPLNILEELIHSCFLSSVYIIMLQFLKSMIWECGPFTTRPLVTLSLPPVNWLTWLEKSNHPSLVQQYD